MMLHYVYKLTQRPMMPGACPKGFEGWEEKDKEKDGCYAEVSYRFKLSAETASDYEMTLDRLTIKYNEL